MFIPTIARKIFPDWNRRVMTATDGFDYCRANRVEVIYGDDHEVLFGLYTVYKNREMIVVNKNLDPQMKAWVLLHEIYHRAAHYPETSFFSAGMENKNDFEANVFSAVSQMPEPFVTNYTIDDICHLFEVPRPLVLIRKYVADNFEI